MSEVVEIVAPMEATVFRVDVAVGDTVAPGDTVVVLEAMKMEIPVTAETGGVVTGVPVGVGDTVDEGGTVVVLAAR